MHKLLTSGRTDLLENFISNKTRRKFKAYLKFDPQQGKVVFEFEPRPQRGAKGAPAKSAAAVTDEATRPAAKKVAAKKSAAKDDEADEPAAKKAVAKKVPARKSGKSGKG